MSCFVSVSAGNNASYSAELAERMKLNTATGPSIHTQFKAPMDRNLTSDNPLERNVSRPN